MVRLLLQIKTFFKYFSALSMSDCFILLIIFSISKMLLITNGQTLYGHKQKDVYYQKNRFDSNIGPYPTASYIKKINEDTRKLQATVRPKVIPELNFNVETLRPATKNDRTVLNFHEVPIHHRVDEEAQDVEYENELKAISEILGIELGDLNEKSLNALKERVKTLIDKVNSDREDEQNGKSNLAHDLENALNTLQQVSGAQALQMLKKFRHQLENVTDTVTDEISNLMDRFKPKINFFGDTITDIIERISNHIEDLMSKFKSKEQEITTEKPPNGPPVENTTQTQPSTTTEPLPRPDEP